MVEMAEARGRVMIRPWRVALLIDTSSVDEVRAAIGALSSVWGGRYMPILDINLPIDELERSARQYDVDSLYADAPDGPIVDLLRRDGFRWGYGGPWGPFGTEEAGLRKGLLPISALLMASEKWIQPTWDRKHPADLVFAAMWGVTDRLEVPFSKEGDMASSRQLPIDLALAEGVSTVGVLHTSPADLRVQPRAYLEGLAGIQVLRPDQPREVVDFWNKRTYGIEVLGVPAHSAEDVVDLLLRDGLPRTEVHPGGAGSAEHMVSVWGLSTASVSTADAIRGAAARQGLVLREHIFRGGPPPYLFQGLRTTVARSVRVDFRPEARWVDIDLPLLDLMDDTEAFARGAVGAEVQWHSVTGQDPRLTATLPPLPRHASLIEQVGIAGGADRIRVTHDGMVLGIDATRDQLRVPFALNQDAIRVLFDNDSVRIDQSDVGRFQTRAAEKFGGPFTGQFSQPGVREALALAARSSAGVTLPQLWGAVMKEQGEWPDQFFGPKVGAKEYARLEINRLLYSGILVPTLRTHCSYCRVESYVAADGLAATMTCEFCGQDFNLALSHSLAKPEWRYRLAAHLGSEQIQALLPALAAASWVRQMRMVEEPPLVHALGLEIAIGERRTEVDLAAYVPDPEWILVLAEVKTGNRFDRQDVANMEFLREELSSAGVRCLLMFATLKAELTSGEKTELRALADRSPVVSLARSNALAVNLPLVLTGRDLSHPPGSQQHPWRWERNRHDGLFGTAFTSCQRNLGLREYHFDTLGSDGHAVCDWEG